MAEATHRVHETTEPAVNDTDAPVEDRDHGKIVAARVIRYITSAILAVLALRFVLALLGANPDNAFASLIYGITQPLVAPFFGLFSYDYSDGIRRFEAFTLVAMAVYALAGYGLARLMTLTRR